MDKIQVFITDCQAVFRKGIRYALYAFSDNDNFEVIGEAAGNIDTLERINKTHPNLLIINADNPEPSGIDVARYVNRHLPYVKVILTLDDDITEKVVAAIKSGAKACISKSTDLDVLIHTIDQIFDDGLPISRYLLRPDVAKLVLEEYHETVDASNGHESSLAKLIHTEEMILEKISGHASLTDVASGLDLPNDVLLEYLYEIVEKLVKIENIIEPPEQNDLSKLVFNGRHALESSPKNQEKLDDLKTRYSREDMNSELPEKMTQDDSIRFVEEAEYEENEEEEEVEEPQPDNHSVEFDGAITEISKVIDLARTAERLSTIQELNRDIQRIMESLSDEIDNRRRLLRKVRKAIESEVELGKNMGLLWEQFSNKKKHGR